MIKHHILKAPTEINRITQKELRVFSTSFKCQPGLTGVHYSRTANQVTFIEVQWLNRKKKHITVN